MSGTGWVVLLVAGVVGYLLIKGTGVSYSANPLGNLPNRPSTPPLPGQQWQWNGFQWVQVPIGAIAL